MVDLYSFDAGGVDAAAKAFVTAENQFETDGRTLQSFIDNINWKGSAGPAFKTAHDAWTAKYNAIVSEAHNIAQTLTTNSNNQQHIETTNVGTANYFK
jgi:uncharacterized protein YukE